METREIKFRVWDVKSETMSDPFFVGWKQCHFENFSIDVCNARCKVIQFTCLRDKNGKEIYEGDIVRWYWNEINGYGPNAVVSMGTRRGSQYTKCTGWIAEDCFVDSKCEVIGNKFENPEMLNNEYNGHY